MGWKGPAPFGPVRRRGWSRRPSADTLVSESRTFAQRTPRVMGWSFAPSMRSTWSPSTWAIHAQVSAQSNGQQPLTFTVSNPFARRVRAPVEASERYVAQYALHWCDFLSITRYVNIQTFCLSGPNGPACELMVHSCSKSGRTANVAIEIWRPIRMHSFAATNARSVVNVRKASWRGIAQTASEICSRARFVHLPALSAGYESTQRPRSAS